jgi:hypothetical protein
MPGTVRVGLTAITAIVACVPAARAPNGEATGVGLGIQRRCGRGLPDRKAREHRRADSVQPGDDRHRGPRALARTRPHGSSGPARGRPSDERRDPREILAERNQLAGMG